MAIQVSDVTLISVSAVAANLATMGISEQQRDTVRIIEIVGGLLTAQLARRNITKAAGAGIMVGALVGYVNDFLGIGGGTRRRVRTAPTYTQLVYNPPPKTSVVNDDIFKEEFII